MLKRLTTCLTLLLSLLAVDSVADSGDKNLAPAQQQLLEAHTSPGMMMGSFDSYASYLYAVRNVMIHTYDDDINSTQIHSTFQANDKPTWREIFDSIAKQTGSQWSYDSEHNYWVFSKGSTVPPFTIAIAPGWKSEYRGNYVSYRPPIAPVGLDIYFKESSGISEQITSSALKSAQKVNPNAKETEMKNQRVGQHDALFYSTVIPSTGIVWRQWVFGADKKEFVIVSAIKPENEKIILPDVQKMVQSFKVNSNSAS